MKNFNRDPQGLAAYQFINSTLDDSILDLSQIKGGYLDFSQLTK